MAQNIPEFNIVAVGPPGSGKTLYLAVLHQFIRSQRLGKGISFSVSNQDRTWLQSVYNYLKDTSMPDLSQRTQVGDIREVRFDCKVEWTGHAPIFRSGVRRHQHDALRVNYADYSGELYSDADRLAVPGIPDALQEKLNTAHVLLGIIDGEKLMRYLKNPDSEPDFLADDVAGIVETLQASKVPAHFVITKWDLLTGYSKEYIDQALRDAVPGYAALKADRSAQRVTAGKAGRTRLIPVSAVGKFARLNATGHVVKVEGEQPTPQDIEIPLVAALVDICDMATAQARERELADLKAARAARKAARAAAAATPPTLSVEVSPTTLKLDLTAVVALTRQGIEAGRRAWSPVAMLGLASRRMYHRVNASQLMAVRSAEGAVFYVGHAFRKHLGAYENLEQ
jgi:hypothetical protein